MITTFLVEHPWITTTGFVACCLIGPAVGYWFVDRQQAGTALAIAGMLPVAALTLIPTDRRLSVGCAAEWSVPTFGAVELMANVVLFVPPVLLLAVVTRRPALVLLGASVVAALIETVQAFATGLGRSCSTNDWLSNSLGAVLGAALACLVLWLHGRSQGVPA